MKGAASATVLGTIFLAGCAPRWIIPWRDPPLLGLPTQAFAARTIKVAVRDLDDQRDDAGARRANLVGQQAEISGNRPIVMHESVPHFVSKTLANGLRSVGLEVAAQNEPCDASISGILTHYWLDSRVQAPESLEASAWVEADLIVRKCPGGEPLLRKRYSGAETRNLDTTADSRTEVKRRFGRLLDAAAQDMVRSLLADHDFLEALRANSGP